VGAHVDDQIGQPVPIDDAGLAKAMLGDPLQCTRSSDHPDGNTVATSLLLTSVTFGTWDCRPRCARHPATADARLIRLATPRARVVIIDLPGQAEQDASPAAAPAAAPGPDTWWVVDHFSKDRNEHLYCGSCVALIPAFLNRIQTQLLDPKPEFWGGECCDGCGKPLVIGQPERLQEAGWAGVSQPAQP